MKTFALMTAATIGLFSVTASANNAAYLPNFDEAPVSGVIVLSDAATAAQTDALIETSAGVEKKANLAQTSTQNYSDTHGIVHVD